MGTRSLLARRCTLLAGVLLGACGGGVSLGDAARGDRRVGDHLVLKDSPPTKDLPRVGDLPTKPGAPCLYGQCAGKLICMANECLSMCTQLLPGCNDKAAECGGPNFACMFASSFTDACYPATAQYLQPCDLAKALYCVGGNLCVKVGTKAPKCLKLCKYGCATSCQKTDNGCDVCIE